MSVATFPAPAEHPGAANPAPLLKVRGLRVSFHQRGREPVRAVDGVSFTVYPGQTVALVGESGSGKSVTALSVLRLVPCPPGRFEGGSISFRSGAADGREIEILQVPDSRMRDLRGNEIAMIFQEPMASLNPVFTVGDQIVEAVRLHQRTGAREAREIAARSLEEVGIDSARGRMADYPHQFSGGMRQRVMIAMALACRPRLLLADEPTTALDVTVQAQILGLLAGLQRARGMGMVLVSHDLGIVARYADVACVMYAGRVVEYAPVPLLLANPMHPYTRGLLACRARLGDRRARLATVREVIDRPGEFDRLPGGRPWWPRHPAPRAASGGYDSTLRRVADGHWVAMWRTGEGAADEDAPPDVSRVRSDAVGAPAPSEAGAGPVCG